MAAPAANAAAPVTNDHFGFMQALKEGGVIAWSRFGMLVIMSVGSWYIFFVKLIEQQNRIIKEGRRARTTFWQSPNLRDARQQARQERRLSPDRRGRPPGRRAAQQADRSDRPA